MKLQIVGGIVAFLLMAWLTIEMEYPIYAWQALGLAVPTRVYAIQFLFGSLSLILGLALAVSIIAETWEAVRSRYRG